MKKHLVVLLMAGPLAGCISFGAKPPKTLLTLTSATSVAPETSRTASAGQTITIMIPTVPAAIANNRVPVYDGVASLSYVKGALWNDSPSRLFQRLLSEVVAVKTGRVVLDVRQYTADPGTRLNGTLQRFGIDPREMKAVVTYDGVLARNGGAIEVRRFEAAVPLSKIEPSATGTALNEAANTVAIEVAAWVGAS